MSRSIPVRRRKSSAPTSSAWRITCISAFGFFGDKISSFYYFFFFLVAVTCLLYVLQFRDNLFLLFLLVIFLGELYFLENYACSYGVELNTVSNSRLFSGLSLVPALHILLLLWRRRPLRAFTVAAVIVQSAIFAFLLSCRTECRAEDGVSVICPTTLYQPDTDFGEYHCKRANRRCDQLVASARTGNIGGGSTLRTAHLWIRFATKT